MEGLKIGRWESWRLLLHLEWNTWLHIKSTPSLCLSFLNHKRMLVHQLWAAKRKALHKSYLRIIYHKMTATRVGFALSSITSPFFTRSFPYLCLSLPITFVLKLASALILHHCAVLQPLQVYPSERSFWIFNQLLQEPWTQHIHQQISPTSLIVMGC